MAKLKPLLGSIFGRGMRMVRRTVFWRGLAIEVRCLGLIFFWSFERILFLPLGWFTFSMQKILLWHFAARKTRHPGRGSVRRCLPTAVFLESPPWFTRQQHSQRYLTGVFWIWFFFSFVIRETNYFEEPRAWFWIGGRCFFFFDYCGSHWFCSIALSGVSRHEQLSCSLFCPPWFFFSFTYGWQAYYWNCPVTSHCQRRISQLLLPLFNVRSFFSRLHTSEGKFFSQNGRIAQYLQVIVCTPIKDLLRWVYFALYRFKKVLNHGILK